MCIHKVYTPVMINCTAMAPTTKPSTRVVIFIPVTPKLAEICLAFYRVIKTTQQDMMTDSSKVIISAQDWLLLLNKIKVAMAPGPKKTGIPNGIMETSDFSIASLDSAAEWLVL